MICIFLEGMGKDLQPLVLYTEVMLTYDASLQCDLRPIMTLLR